MASSGLTDILAAIGLRETGIDKEAGAGEEVYKLMAQLGEQAKANQEKAAAKEAAVLEERARLNLQTEAAKKEAGKLFGTDLRNPNNQLAYLSQERDATFSQLMAMKAGLEAKKGVGFLDDPLQYITNAFALPQETADYNALVDKYNMLGGRISTLNSETQGTVHTQALLETKNSQALAQEELEVAQIQSAQKLLGIRAENLKINLEGIKWLANADEKKLNLAISKYNILKGEELLALQLEERTERIKDKKDAEQLREYYNLGRATLNMPPLDSPSFKLQLSIDSKEVNDFIKRGVSSEIGALRVDATPGESFGTLAKYKTQLPAGMEPVQNFFNSVAREVEASFQGQKVDPVVFQRTMNGKILGNKGAKQKGYADRMLKDVENPFSNKIPNIYRIPDVPSLIAASPKLAETPLYINVLKPLVDSGVRHPTADQMLASVVEAFRAKKITYGQAVSGITAYHKAGVFTNNTVKRYTSVGLPVQESYIVSVNDGSLFFNEVKVNMIDETEVSMFFTRLFGNQILNQRFTKQAGE